MSAEVVAALDRLTAAFKEGQAEARAWENKVAEIFDEIRASVGSAAMDAGESRQSLADCELHLRVLAEHFSPQNWD